MKFRYTEYGKSMRPIIPVIVSNGKKSIDYEVMIDSGSDHTFFDAQVADMIGINKEGGEVKEVFGLGGKIHLYYTHTVTITIGDVRYKTEVGFISVLGGGIFNYGLAGQKGFFDHFVVKFDLIGNKIELKRKSK